MDRISTNVGFNNSVAKVQIPTFVILLFFVTKGESIQLKFS